MKKVALVTGASRGIGRAVARRLAEDGYAVAVHYHRLESGACSLVDELWQSGYEAAAYGCDISDGDAVREMLRAIREELGPIDVLVNNAGIAQQKLFTDLTDEDWHRMMAVDVDGVFYTCRGVLPEMIRAHHGCIVNISSMWGQVGASCEVHYSAAKAAVIGLTKALAKEVGPSGIRVNCVAPGVVQTDMMLDFDMNTLDALTEDTPLGRLGSPDDVARAVAFLVSADADFITGQVLGVNGGFVI